MKFLLPVVLLLIGLGAGGGAGWFLRPATDPARGQDAAAHGDGASGQATPAVQFQPPPPVTETVRLPSQFVVPLITEGQVRAMVVIGLALEMTPGHDFSLAQDEARLRAVFLQLLFDHANIGGFDGVFTSGEALLALRRSLREAARIEVGPEVYDVLITELLRQES